MWRRVVLSSSSSSAQLQALASCRSSSLNLKLSRRFLISSASTPSTLPPFQHFSASASALKDKVDDIMPIATGHEREELQAELEEAPAIVKSYYDKRVVRCPGVEGGKLYQQSPHVGQYQQSPHVGQYQQSPHVGQYQQSPHVGQYQQSPHVGQYQQSPHVGQYQQSPHVGQYQQSPHVGQYQQSPPVGQYQKIPQAGEYQQSPQVREYRQSPQVGQPDEASESNPNHVKGTLEELDLFCKEGKVKEAVEVLGLLERQHVHVNLDQYLRLMQACGEAKALNEAKAVHENMRLLSPLEVSTYNRILEMYSKCGSMENAFMVFNDMPRNLTSWDIMITWLAKNGLEEDAIDLFTQFKKAGLKPDGQMFIAVFCACSVVGDAHEGLLHFESMSKDYGIVPTMDHYVSVVDMLGTIGFLDEALEFVKKMPLEPNVVVWKTLMNLCRVHGYMELGDCCAELVDQMDPSCLNEQSKAGLVPANESDLIKEKEKKQLAASNLLAVRSQVHEYRAGDRSHPDNEKHYTLLRGLREQMKEAGYIPETRFVLHDIDQEGKEDALLSHSERLAVAHGLINSSARSPIRVIKNLRVCGDCHSALKIISKIVGRELIMRDAKRFHHLKDGKCSCNDYW
ncbi:hypothetical protein M0R45_020114 [Rubus argutus]|uniref:DYW domain-containing protein n=1 Tax=Rubus argutus TaxID=59490 RepID=A0AAW1XAN3_RUBAR